MEDLPAELTIDILSRLPVKSIFHCKRVCKKWWNLVSEFSFVNLHLSRSPTGISIQSKRYSTDPGILKWVEIEDKVNRHHLHHAPLMSLNLNLAPILQNSRIFQMGSVNGLICLYQNFVSSIKLDNAYICNPITREYMILPRQQDYKESTCLMVYGFGVSSRTGEYKVVRTFQGDALPDGDNGLWSWPSVEAEVYTLGTGQWRSLGRVPYLFCVVYGIYGPFLNDHCHWIVNVPGDAPICTFDLDKETFQLFPSPPTEAVQVIRSNYQGLAVLKGCLCKFDTYDSELVIWVMKEYGIKKSWHKELVITEEISVGIKWPLLEPMSVIEGSKDGSILIVFQDKLWAFYPQNGTFEDTKMFDRDLSGLACRLSFLKLQNFESERVQMF